MSFVLLVGLLFFGVQFARVHGHILTFPYQLELREGAVPVFTQMLLAGDDPYLLEGHPVSTNPYGIGYYAFVYPVARLLGPTLAVHRAVSGVFIVASCVLLLLVVRRRGGGWPAALATAVAGYATLLFFFVPLARPDAAGLFLFLAALFVPWASGYRRAGLAAGIVLGTAAFLTKPYFVLALPFLAAYMFLFVSKRKGALFALAGAAFLGAATWAVGARWEMYLYDLMAARYAASGYQLTHALAQFQTWLTWYAALLPIATLALAAAWWRRRDSPRASAGAALEPRVDLRRPQRPFFRARIDLPEFCLVASVAAILYPLGGSGGAWMSYLLELISPFFLVVTAAWAESAVRATDRYRTVAAATIATLTLGCLFMLDQRLESVETFEAALPGWSQLDAGLRTYNDVLGSPAIVTILMQQGKPVYDSGLSKYFHRVARRASSPGDDLQRKVRERDAAYAAQIARGVQEHRYDLVVADAHGALPYLPAKVLAASYQQRGATVLLMPAGEVWTLTFWTPQADPPVGPDTGPRH